MPKRKKKERLIIPKRKDSIELLEWQSPFGNGTYNDIMTMASDEKYELSINSEWTDFRCVYYGGKFLGKYDVYSGTVVYKEKRGEALIVTDFKKPADSKLYVKFPKLKN